MIIKKILILILLLCIPLSSFANSELYKISRKEKKQYIIEIEKIINDKYDDVISDIENKTKPIENIYKTFISNKNDMKLNKSLIEKLDIIYSDFDSAEFYLYLSIINKTNEYVANKLTIPSTDYTGTLKYFIYPYLNKYKVNTEKLDNLSEITAKKSNAINKIKNEIIDFSTDYENKKVDKFYDKYISPKISQLEVKELWQDYLWQSNSFKTNELYWVKPNIIQTFSDSFLANAQSYYYDSTFLLLDKESYKLDPEDVFERPFVVLFTGQYFSYTTTLGRKMKVPTFRLLTENDLKIRTTNPPKFNDTLYFISKPDYTQQLKEKSNGLLIRPIYLYNNRYYHNSQNMIRIWKK